MRKDEQIKELQDRLDALEHHLNDAFMLIAKQKKEIEGLRKVVSTITGGDAT